MTILRDTYGISNSVAARRALDDLFDKLIARGELVDKPVISNKAAIKQSLQFLQPYLQTTGLRHCIKLPAILSVFLKILQNL